jgi:cell division protease FtsH
MSSKTISEATQQKVDAEIRRILDEQYSVARKLIEKNRRKVEAMAKALLEYETIDADQINDIMAGKKARPPKPKQTPNPPKIDKGSSGTKVAVVPQPSAKG